jgi:phosphatidylglycerol:prolipoprotein diacylglycerol transferase
MFILLWLFARKSRPRMAVGGMFALLYGSARFFTEYFRMPDYEVHFASVTISAGQMLSIPLVVLGIVMLFLAYRTKTPQVAQ